MHLSICVQGHPKWNVEFQVVGGRQQKRFIIHFLLLLLLLSPTHKTHSVGRWYLQKKSVEYCWHNWILKKLPFVPLTHHFCAKLLVVFILLSTFFYSYTFWYHTHTYTNTPVTRMKRRWTDNIILKSLIILSPLLYYYHWLGNWLIHWWGEKEVFGVEYFSTIALWWIFFCRKCNQKFYRLLQINISVVVQWWCMVVLHDVMMSLKNIFEPGWTKVKTRLNQVKI